MFKRTLTLALFLCVSPLSAIADGATINGTIKYDGKVPKLPPLKMDADPDCAAKHKEAPLAEFLVLGAGNTLGNIFVNVKGGIPGKEHAAPSEPVVVNQQGCVYHPHVFGVVAGQPVMFKNTDGVLHNVHALPKTNRPFNLAMPKTMVDSPHQSFAKVEEEAFPIKCDVHPWMNSYAKVMSHPYFSVTGPDGKFTLKGLPAGTYQIEAWHEKLGTMTQSVTVGANESKTADFIFVRKEKA